MNMERGREKIPDSTKFKTNISANLIEGQGRSIKNKLEDAGLKDVRVESKTKIRHAEDYKDRMTHGILNGVEERDPLAFLTSSATDEHTVSTFLVAPDKTSSGLLVDDKTDKVYTESFWEASKKGDGVVVEHIRTTKPIPVDLATSYDSIEDPVLDAQAEGKLTKAIEDLTEDKQATKEVLQNAGISVPEGIHITDFTTDPQGAIEKYHEFVETLPPDSQVAFKPNNGVQGNYVALGDPSDDKFVQYLSSFADTLAKEGKSFLIERRIDPPPLPALERFAHEYLDQIDPKGEKTRPTAEELDYNFRVLTTFGPNPEVIDAEIRLNYKDYQPVNVSKKAIAARLDVLDDPELTARIFETAQKSVSATYEHVKIPGEDTSYPYYVGVDIILDRDETGTLYTMEVQSGPGGVGTLAKLDQAPLASIRDKFIPSQVPYLQKRLEDRPPEDPEHLRKIPLTRTGKLLLCRSYYESGDIEATQKLFYELASASEAFDIETNLRDLDIFAEKTENYKYMYQYLNELVERFPDDPKYQELRDRVFNGEIKGKG